MDDPVSIFPIWVIVIDYILGLVIWTLIVRAALNIFLPDNTNFFFTRIFVPSTDTLVKFFPPITPGFTIRTLVPPYPLSSS